MSQAQEIIATPIEVYTAPIGEAFPSIDTEPPGGNWTLLGTNGSRNYDEEGVVVEHTESVEDFRMLGSTGILKSVRTEEGLTIRLTLRDLTLEQLKFALNANTVTTTAAGAGQPGERDIDLYKGRTISEFALLVRGDFSAYADGFNTQFEVPRVRLGGEPEVTYEKGTPAGVEIEFVALEDENASTDADRFGKLRVQEAAAT